MTKSTEKVIRISLGMLLLLLALNAFVGGYYGMAGAKNIPIEWLKGSLFHNYFIPGLFLFVVIGGLSLYASVAVLRKWRTNRNAAPVCGIIVLVWLMIQVAVIGYVSWMQPTTAGVAVIILFLTLKLPSYVNYLFSVLATNDCDSIC